jgi:hypothetical protein
MKSKTYLIASLAVFVLFFAANYYSYTRMRYGFCDDCFITFGFPFELWREGGFVGGRTILWSGLIANVSIAIWASILFGWALKKFLRRRSTVGSLDSVNDAT